MHQPTLMSQQTTLSQNQILPTLTFGTIIHPISPEPLNRASILQKLKADSYPQRTLPVDSKAAQKQTESNRSPSAKVQHDSSPFNTKRVPTNINMYTAVSNWLAASQTFEKPPDQASIADPAAPQERLDKEHWLQMSKDLDLRIRSRSEQQLKAHTRSSPPRIVYESHTLNSNITQTKLSNPPAAEHTPPLGQTHALPDTSSYPRFADMKDSAKEQDGGREREMKNSIKADTRPLLEEKKLEKHKREQEEELKGNGLKEADDEAVKNPPTAKQLDAAKTEKMDNDDDDDGRKVRAKEEEEQQERKRYVGMRARDIHEDLLLCKPFDMDAVRREFSDEEVGHVKRIVRELGFERKG